MPISFSCPRCNNRFKDLRDSLAGHAIACRCGANLRVPPPAPPQATKRPSRSPASPTPADEPATKTPTERLVCPACGMISKGAPETCPDCGFEFDLAADTGDSERPPRIIFIAGGALALLLLFGAISLLGGGGSDAAPSVDETAAGPDSASSRPRGRRPIESRRRGSNDDAGGERATEEAREALAERPPAKPYRSVARGRTVVAGRDQDLCERIARRIAKDEFWTAYFEERGGEGPALAFHVVGERTIHPVGGIGEGDFDPGVARVSLAVLEHDAPPDAEPIYQGRRSASTPAVVTVEAGAPHTAQSEALRVAEGSAAGPLLRAALVAAVRSLEEAGGERLIATLLASIESSDDDRATAIELLGDLGGGDVAPALARAALEDGAESIRHAAATALARASGDPSATVDPFLAVLDELTGEDVREDDRDRDAWRRLRAALDALARSRPAHARRIAPRLEALARDDASLGVREAAIGTLGRVAGASHVPLTTLLEILASGPSSRDRKAAADALGACRARSPEVVPALVAVLDDRAIGVPDAARESLAELDPAVTVPALAAALTDEDARRRLAAAGVLGELGAAAAEAVPDLVRAAEAARRRRGLGTYVGALVKIGPDAVRALRDGLDDIEDDAAIVAAFDEVIAALGEREESDERSSTYRLADRLAAALGAERSEEPKPAEAPERPRARPRPSGDVVPGSKRVKASDLVKVLEDDGAGSSAWHAASEDFIHVLDARQAARAAKRLAKLLDDENAWRRRYAAAAIGSLGERAEPALDAFRKAMLDDDDSGVRRSLADAVLAIGPDASPEALDAHCDLLESRTGPRQDVLAALEGASLDPTDRRVARVIEDRLVPVLAGLVDVASVGIARGSIGLLGRLGGRALPAMPSLLKTRRGYYEATKTAILALGAGAAPALGDALDNEDRGVRDRAIVFLDALGADAAGAIDGLTAALADGDRRFAKRAANVIAQIGPDAVAAAPGLLEQSRAEGDPKPFLRALGALGEAAEPVARVPLLAIARSDDAALHDRIAAVEALGAIAPGDGELAALLIDLLDAESGQLEAAVERALARLRGEAVVPHLVRALQSKNHRARGFALRAIGELEPAEARSIVPELCDLLEPGAAPGGLGGVVSLLGGIGPDAARAAPRIAEHLIEDAPSGFATDCGYALLLMGDAALPALRRVIAGGEEPCFSLAWSLRRVRSEDGGVAPGLRVALDCPDPTVRLEAAAAMSRVGITIDAKATRALASTLAPGAAIDGQTHALRLLERAGPDAVDAVPKVAAMLDDERYDVRDAAIETLGAIAPGDGAAPILLGRFLTGGHGDARQAAARAIGELGQGASDAAPALRKLLTSRDWHLAREARDALTRLQGR